MFILVVDAVVAGVLAGLSKRSRWLGRSDRNCVSGSGHGYFMAGCWHFVRRYRLGQREYEALFPHPAE